MTLSKQSVVRGLRPLSAPVNLSQAVANHLREAILGGVLPPGARLVERDIAEQLGISRMPVREAIQRLVDDGLLVKEPRRGAYVHPYSDRELEEIYSLRLVLERFAVERVVERWCDSAGEELQAIVDGMIAAARSGDIYGVYELDDAFHQALWRLADHNLLLEIVTGLRARISRFLLEATHLLSADELQSHVLTHQQLLDTLKRRDLQRAQLEMTRHIEIAKDRIREHYRSRFQPDA